MGRKRGKQAAAKVERGKGRITKPTTVTPPPVPQNQQVVNTFDGFQFEDETMDYSFDDSHHELAENLVAINRKEAANFVRVSARYLDSFKSSDSLVECFKWGETRNGYAFWEECYHELITAGYENEIETDLTFWGLDNKGKVA